MCLIEDQSWIDCIDITSRWDAFVSFHLYGNKGVSLPLWPIRPRWFHTYRPCAEPLGDGHEGMWARFGSQGSIALNWHSRYSGTRYSGTWLYYDTVTCIRWLTEQWYIIYKYRHKYKRNIHARSCHLSYIDHGLVQHCGIFTADALKILPSCPKPRHFLSPIIHKDIMYVYFFSQMAHVAQQPLLGLLYWFPVM